MNPSDTAARVNKSFDVGHYSQYSRETLEAALDAASNHPSDEVNRRYIVPLQVAYASAMAECDRLRNALQRLAGAVTDHHAGAEGLVPGCSVCDALVKARAALADATKPSP